jgi:hypothetical protein
MRSYLANCSGNHLLKWLVQPLFADRYKWTTARLRDRNYEVFKEN